MRTVASNLRQAVGSWGFALPRRRRSFRSFPQFRGYWRGSVRRSCFPPASTATLSWARCRPAAMALALPILAALPYTASFIDDVKSGFIKGIPAPPTVPRYIAGKAVGCAVSGGLSARPWYIIPAPYGFAAHVPAHGSLPKAGETVPNYFNNLMETALMFFASGAFWSLTGMTFAALTDSKYGIRLALRAVLSAHNPV